MHVVFINNRQRLIPKHMQIPESLITFACYTLEVKICFYHSITHLYLKWYAIITTSVVWNAACLSVLQKNAYAAPSPKIKMVI